MTEAQMIQLRMERQHLLNAIDDKDTYETFFKRMQPVTPMYFSRPGDPPTLIHRTTFDDKAHNDVLRGKRIILKGRFQGGTVGYVYQDELPLYVAAYKKEIKSFSDKAFYILKLFREEGPLTIHQIKAISGLLVKEITPILHKLIQAFIIYEDQVDSDWERGFFLLEDEFSHLDFNQYTKEEAIKVLVLRAIYCHGFSTLKGLKSYLRLSTKDIVTAVNTLLNEKQISEIEINQNSGYLLTSDINMDIKQQDCKSVFVLHRYDFLVKMNEDVLKEQFKGKEILQYILIDGKFQGAVCGHWRIGPHDVDDIVLTLPNSECEKRKAEIISAVKQFYAPPFSQILAYNGSKL